MEWQPIETAPKGTPRCEGALGVRFMWLAWISPEGGMETGDGMRIGDKFYSAGVFYTGGPFEGKQFTLREIELQPTHWMPRPDPPA